ncbi:MAG TPA: DUF4349 domain-containing protein [Gemmataceae bacterium]|jgi:hypothetical protein
MSDHTWVLENIAAYLADGLEPAERERLEAHTAECATCTAALNAARDMDVTLTTLFVPARPSAVLEDRVIQALRTRPPDTWRLPVPGWLALAVAALLLIGFTGAVASQIIVRGGLPFPGLSENIPTGSAAANLLGYQEEPMWQPPAIAQLAAESREKALKGLDAGDVKNVNQENNQLGFYPPAQALSTKASSTIHNEGWSQLVSPDPKSTPPSTPSNKKDQEAGRKESPPPPISPYMNTFDGSMHSGGGMMGMNGGVATANPSNFRGWLLNKPGEANGRTLTYFEPGKALYDHQPEAQKPIYQPPPGKAEPPPPRDEQQKDKTNNKQPDKKPQAQPGARKIVIRTGEIEYEVASFDAAVATITRLVKDIKGGFVATVNSDKLTNGKVRGSVVVRVPPENLDTLLLDLRTNLGKGGELKNQRIHSNDITKQYTDLESRLKAARAMEERLLQIIKNGKGEIKDLLAVEKELGEWRTRIEEIEGNLRFYANQVALSTLTITLYEKEIQAPFGVVEREHVQMGVEVEDVDTALREALKAVREAKGRVTRSELKQPSQGQFSALLDFEVAPDAAGPLRDRIKQLGDLARLDISRLEETEGGTGKPSDGKTTRKDTRFHVSLYNLTNVAPREVVSVNLACIDVTAAFQTLLVRAEKAAGRVTASNLTRGPSNQTQGVLQFEVKTILADAVLEDVKSAGEVMRLQAAPNPAVNPEQATRKKRGFAVQLLPLEAATARETIEMQLVCTDVAASYRDVRNAVAKAKGHVRNAQLNEQDRPNITATLDFDIRRSEEDVVRAALEKTGAEYTRKATRAGENENVIDSKVRWQVNFLNQANVPPRETYVYGVEVADVDRTAAALSALVGERQGRTLKAGVARERNGRVTGKLIYDVPMAKVHEVLDQLKSSGSVRVQRSEKHPEVPDSPLAIARLDVTLSNVELLVPSDEGFWPKIRQGLSFSFMALAWSLMVVIVGLCFLLPWALVFWAIYRLVVRMRRRASAATPSA